MLLLALRFLLDARLASSLLGGPWLVDICERESGCGVGIVGVHEGDRHHERTLGVGWSTRGAHGMMARYAWPHVPACLRWWGPSVIDLPLVSAIVSVRRAASWRCRQTRACRAWRGQ